MKADVIVVGAGPAGSTAAVLLAAAGRRVVVLEKSAFPRDKVCGDCLNPSVWPILERLGVADRVRASHPTIVRRVEFLGAHGESVGVDLPESANPEIVMRRRDFDALLMEMAVAAGAEFFTSCPVTAVDAPGSLSTPNGEFSAPLVLAADGRNSTVARMLGRLPPASKDRVALQTHTTAANPGAAVRMFFHSRGYGGLAALSPIETNLCLVSGATQIDALRKVAESLYGLPADTQWNAITPLSRADGRPLAASGFFLLGDAARVVEPFTGEGIFYAMRSGEMAADSIVSSASISAAESSYARSHRAMYQGRLWVNRISQVAALNPVWTSRLLPICGAFPLPLRLLTRKVAAGASV